MDLESRSPCPLIEPPVRSKSKPMQRQSLLRAWKRVPWIRSLSGLTLEPSTADAGVDSWTSSMRASRALPSATPASKREPPTNDGSGMISRGLFARLSPDGSFSKTSPQSWLFPMPSEPYSETYPKAGSMRSGRLYRRAPWVPPTGACGSSCSPSDEWPTPNTMHQAEEPDTWRARRVKKKAENPKLGDLHLQLGTCALAWAQAEQASQTWQTPQLPNGGGKTRGGERSDEVLLEGQAANWATPTATDHKDGACGHLEMEANGNLGIQACQVDLWCTPKVAQADKPLRPAEAVRQEIATHSRGGTTTGKIEDQVSLWATPDTGESPRGHGRRGGRSGNGHQSGADLERQSAAFPSSLPAPATGTPGPPSSAITPTSPPHSARRRLNPRFVEWLMGWPPGWALPAPTSCGSSETESFLSAQRSRLRSLLGD